MKRLPKVSICLPNLSNRVFLEERLRSIYRQSFIDWELVIVDNHSEDGAFELLRESCFRRELTRKNHAAYP